MRKGLMLVVVLLAVASMMAAMAYTSATVRSDMSVTIADTDSSLLALIKGDHNATTYVAVGHKSLAKVLNIDLSKGYDNGAFGLQADSIYTWEDLFKVKNNSENAVNVTIKLVSALGEGKVYSQRDNGPGHFAVFARADGDWVKIADTHGASKLNFTLDSNLEQAIDFKVEVEKGYAEDYKFDLIVEANALNTVE